MYTLEPEISRRFCARLRYLPGHDANPPTRTMGSSAMQESINVSSRRPPHQGRSMLLGLTQRLEGRPHRVVEDGPVHPGPCEDPHAVQDAHQEMGEGFRVFVGGDLACGASAHQRALERVLGAAYVA